MTESERRPRVLHLSGDFPDPIHSAKTPVIQHLVDLTSDDFDHFVLSLNRTSPGIKDAFSSSRPGSDGAPIKRLEAFKYGLAIEYAAPPKGVLHRTLLLGLADRLVERLETHQRPDVIIGHKLTIEGIVAERLSKKLGVPYCVSIQGNTDAKILSVRPDLTGRFRQIYHGAAFAFPFTPWACAKMESKLGVREGLQSLLPCATDLDELLDPVTPGNGFLSVFHLWNHRGKNLERMAAAIGLLGKEGSAPRLEIAGGGTDDEVRACETLVAPFPSVKLLGPLDRAALRRKLNQATGFVLPSLRESFGLVFIEALFAGAPIIYPKGQAVDGYFDGRPFAIAVDARSPREIAEAMRWLEENESQAKEALRKWQQSPAANRFTRTAIAETFRDGLQAALAGV